MSENVCFVDTETTGLDPDRHAIWEVGLITPNGDGLITPNGDEHVWQFPVDEMSADPFALTIGQWWDRRWLGGGDWLDAVYDAHKPDKLPKRVVPSGHLQSWAVHFRDLVGTSHLCGAVPSFDEERLRRLLRRLGVLPRWHYHLIDVEALAAGWIAATAPNLADARPPWNSTDLSKFVGVDPDDFDRHTALGDARWAKAIYEVVMA